MAEKNDEYRADWSIEKVRHDPDEMRFYLPLEEGEAYMDYRRPGEDVVAYVHTWTDPELRGRGLAAVVVEAALQWAREENLKVQPSCPYVASFIDDHPEYRELRA